MRVEIVGKNGFEFHERTEELVIKRLRISSKMVLLKQQE